MGTSGSRTSKKKEMNTTIKTEEVSKTEKEEEINPSIKTEYGKK